MIEYCYVLDYTNAEIYCLCFNYGDKNPENINTTYEQLISDCGFNPDNCHWMITDKLLNVVNITLNVK